MTEQAALANAFQAAMQPAAPVPPPSKPQPRFVTDHRKVVELKCPIEYDGKVYTRITVSPISVAQYNTALAAGDTNRLPMFQDEQGGIVPVEVLDFMTLRDSARLNEAAADFLPQNSPDDTVQPLTSANGGSSPEQ